jgi:hypothetical protein
LTPPLFGLVPPGPFDAFADPLEYAEWPFLFGLPPDFQDGHERRILAIPSRRAGESHQPPGGDDELRRAESHGMRIVPAGSPVTRHCHMTGQRREHAVDLEPWFARICRQLRAWADRPADPIRPTPLGASPHRQRWGPEQGR